MGVIYTLLALMGTMSLGRFKVSENGGIALAQIAQHYLDYGIIILSLIIIVACLKTYRIDHSLFGNIYRVIP